MGRLTDLYGQLETAAQRKPQDSLLQALDKSGFMAAMPRREFFRVFPSLLENHLEVQAGQGARFDELLQTLRAGREIQQIGLDQQRLMNMARGLDLEQVRVGLHARELMAELDPEQQSDLMKAASLVKGSGLGQTTLEDLISGKLKVEDLPPEQAPAAQQILKLMKPKVGRPKEAKALASNLTTIAIAGEDYLQPHRLTMAEDRRVGTDLWEALGISVDGQPFTEAGAQPTGQAPTPSGAKQPEKAKQVGMLDKVVAGAKLAGKLGPTMVARHIAGGAPSGRQPSTQPSAAGAAARGQAKKTQKPGMFGQIMAGGRNLPADKPEDMADGEYYGPLIVDGERWIGQWDAKAKRMRLVVRIGTGNGQGGG